MARMGFSYFDTILMPARVIGVLLDQRRSRQKRLEGVAKRNKPMAVYDLGSID